MGICRINLIMKIITFMCFIILHESIRKPGTGMKAYTKAAFCKWAFLHFQLIHIFQDLLHMNIGPFSLRCQLDPFCMADKQLGTHVVFHRTDHLAYIGLRGKKQLCSLAEGACFGTGCKILYLFYIEHDPTSVSLQRSKTSGSDCKTRLFLYKYVC